ncbi:uncharacterized protein B0H18DRAFT_961783 [Fomitopsis serialis]|uniref:uncharacterized protein n=1 Tax=Fomitopsis serialis TaxID=139415 RepID=UPI00200834EF|nr:uncharacterized protein B0H18DRAFT_961783 [Neoantrodia serialis]KAH9911791.1 hypothetical protein B0H18DRAFT_961783 [Neoantrodia serialis]
MQHSCSAPGPTGSFVLRSLHGEARAKFNQTVAQPGVSSENVTLCVPRLKEIINVATNIKTPSLILAHESSVLTYFPIIIPDITSLQPAVPVIQPNVTTMSPFVAEVFTGLTSINRISQVLHILMPYQPAIQNGRNLSYTMTAFENVSYTSDSPSAVAERCESVGGFGSRQNEHSVVQCGDQAQAVRQAP